MRRMKPGDRVKAFLDANIRGEIIEIVHRPAPATALMVGGVPPFEAYANIRLANGNIVTVKTTELFHEDG